MITISNPRKLYFTEHPIRFSITTDDTAVTKFRIEIFEGSTPVGKAIETKFFNQTITMWFQKTIDDYLHRVEKIRIPTGATLKSYAPRSFTIRATELISGVAQANPQTTTPFVVHRGKLPVHLFNENDESLDNFDHTTNSFLTNYPTPERIFNNHIKYITYLNTFQPANYGTYNLSFVANWKGGTYTESIPFPMHLSLVQIEIDTDAFGIPHDVKQFNIQMFISQDDTQNGNDDNNEGTSNRSFSTESVSEVRTYEIIQAKCRDNHDFLFFNRYNQPQAFRCTDGWTVFNSVTRNNFRDSRNYRQARTKEAFRSYASKRPFLRENEIKALSEMRTSNHVFIWEDGDWRRVNLKQRKWTEKKQYTYLHTLELTFDKSAPN